MRKFFRRILIRLGLVKPNVITGARARVFIAGREVAFCEGEDVEFKFNPKPIEVLGRLDVVELYDHTDVEVMVKGKK